MFKIKLKINILFNLKEPLLLHTLFQHVVEICLHAHVNMLNTNQFPCF